MRRWMWVLPLLVVLSPAATVTAEEYPSRPIRAIASQGAGGLSDLFMRALADKMGAALGTTIIVEDRVGAGGSIGARACGEAQPDGYTICILPHEAVVINPIIAPMADFDPKRDLAPITSPFYLTSVFALNASLNVHSFAELAALAKAKPKTLNYMAATLPKIAFMEAFNRNNGTDLVRVPFKGGGDAANNMLTGTTPVAIFGIGNLLQFIRNGTIVGVAVDGTTRSPLAPEIPTFKELGYFEHTSPSYFGIYAPHGTPAPIIDKLNKTIIAIASNLEFQQRNMISRGLLPVLNSPAEFTQQLETARAEGLAAVKGSGLYPDVK